MEHARDDAPTKERGGEIDLSNYASFENQKQIEYLWAPWGRTESVADLELAMCQPELANVELSNANELRGKLAVAKRGGGLFWEKAQRVANAGARGLVIINTDDTLVAPGCTIDGYTVAIPVVMINAEDGPRLLESGKSSCLVPAKHQLLKILLAMQDTARWKEIQQLEREAFIAAHAFRNSELRSLHSNAGVIFNCMGNCYLSMGKYRQAIEMNERILMISGEMRGRVSQAKAYGNLGICYSKLGQFTKAIEKHIQCLTIEQELGHRRGEGETLGNLGGCYLYVGEYQKAISMHEEELAIAKDLRDRAGQSHAYNHLGIIYMSTGQFALAIDFLEKARASALDVSDEMVMGNVCNSIGNTYFVLGQFIAAIELHEQARAIAHKIGDPREEATSCGWLGNCYSALKQFSRAIALHEQRITIAREIGDMVGEAAAYNSLGDCHGMLGSYELAIEWHQKALHIAKIVGDRSTECSCLMLQGKCCQALGRYQAAISFQEEALVIAQGLGDRLSQSQGFTNLGAALYRNGDPVAAVGAFSRALALSQRVEQDVGAHDDRRVSLFEGQQHTYRLLQGVFLELDHPKWALAVSAQAKARALAHHLGVNGEGNDTGGTSDKTDDCSYETMCGEWWKEVQIMAEAEGIGVSVIEFSILSNESLDDTLAVWVMSGTVLQYHGSSEISSLASSLGIPGCSVADALEILRVGMASNGRSARCEDLLAGAFQKIVPAFRGMQVDSVEDLVSAMLPAFKDAIDEQPNKDESQTCSDDAGSWLPSAIQEWQEVHAWLDAHGKHEQEAVKWLKCRVQSWQSLREMVSGLQCTKSACDEQILRDWLEAFVKQKTLVLAWLDAEIQRVQEAAKTAKELKEALEIMKGKVHQWDDLAICDDDRWADKAREEFGVNDSAARRQLRKRIKELFSPTRILGCLHELFIGPIAKVIEAASELLIIPHPHHSAVPWSALIDKSGTYLVETHDIRVAPSLRVARQTACRLQMQSPGKTGHALVIGNPWPNRISNLPFAEEEAKKIAEVLKSTGMEIHTLLQHLASKDNVKHLLRNAMWAHFACHSDLQQKSLVLASPCSSTSGYEHASDLTMAEVQGSGSQCGVQVADAATIILGACNTGRGEIKAEGVVGLARGFLAAGASATVVSLWSVDDGSTSALMEIFYRNLASGLAVPRALRLAMLKLCGRAPVIPSTSQDAMVSAAGPKGEDQGGSDICCATETKGDDGVVNVETAGPEQSNGIVRGKWKAPEKEATLPNPFNTKSCDEKYPLAWNSPMHWGGFLVIGASTQLPLVK